MKKKVVFGLVLSLLIFICCLDATIFALRPEYCDIAIKIGNYIIENNATQMDTAKVWKISKKTVRNYIKKLKKIRPELYEKVRKITEQHKHLGSKSWDLNEFRCRSRTYLTKAVDQYVLAVEIGEYIVNNNATYMDVSAKFDISETTSRRYVKKLEIIRPELYEQVKKIVEQHKHCNCYNCEFL